MSDCEHKDVYALCLGKFEYDVDFEGGSLVHRMDDVRICDEWERDYYCFDCGEAIEMVDEGTIAARWEILAEPEVIH